MFAMTSLCTQGNKLTQDAVAYNCARLLEISGGFDDFVLSCKCRTQPYAEAWLVVRIPDH